MSHFAKQIRPFVDIELEIAKQAESNKEKVRAFTHLQRAHVLGQTSTREHVRVHWHMLKFALRQNMRGEVRGQLLRLLGACTKTIFGWVPSGNTGQAQVSAFQSMPIPEDLNQTIKRAKLRK